MPRPSLGASIVAEQKVELSPQLRAKLKAKIDEHETRQRKIEELEDAQAELKESVKELFKKAGKTDVFVDGLKVDGVPVQYVTGDCTYFDKEEFEKLGGDLDIYNAARKKKPKKPFVKIGTGRKRKKGEEDE